MPAELQFRLAGTEVRLETGRLARQASGAVLARSGDNVILATVVGAREPRPDASFFPLTVEYREKLAAAGRIPGTYNRREGRISDHEVLCSRLIDRTLRSLFPDGYRAEVQVQITVLSAAPGTDLSTLALIAACAAVRVSPIPCAGPAAGLRILKQGDAFSTFPSEEKRGQADLDFVVSSGPDGLVMVEGEAREISEADCAAALQQALDWLAKVHKEIDKLAEQAGSEKWPLAEPEALPEVPEPAQAELRGLLEAETDKSARSEAYAAFKQAQLEALEDPEQTARYALALDACKKDLVRAAILDGRRPDGRGPADIRPIWSEVGWLPRCHGSAIFTRGETQALVSCTLGTPDDALRLEGLGGRGEDPFILHYNFPPYSVGETRPLRGPGRREIGHGTLARRGLAPLLPSAADFPYTIRVESEISESNGSSSMATVCGGSLAMFQAGVPMARAAAGIAMGMVARGTRKTVLSDIVGEEDHLGDMDFKVIGSKRGITALQLDNKIGGLSFEDLQKALEQARLGRLHIIKQMQKTLPEPNKRPAEHAPQVSKLHIMPGSVGILVGPRGATIKEIQAESEARISVDDHGQVLIYAAAGSAADKARRRVEQLVGVLETGGHYRGTVTGIKDFGAFVRINEVNEGLVRREHISTQPFERIGEVLEQGAEVVVRVLGVDDRGSLRLSIKEAEGVDPALIRF